MIFTHSNVTAKVFFQKLGFLVSPVTLADRSLKNYDFLINLKYSALETLINRGLWRLLPFFVKKSKNCVTTKAFFQKL